MEAEEKWAAENGGFMQLIEGWASVNKLALRALVEERDALREALMAPGGPQEAHGGRSEVSAPIGGHEANSQPEKRRWPSDGMWWLEGCEGA